MHSLLSKLKSTKWYGAVRNWRRGRRQRREFENWERQGRPLPPPHLVKQRVLIEYAGRFGLKLLVETGTYRGEMVEAMKNHFSEIYSIEVSRDLFEQAKRRFISDRHVEILLGDGGEVLQSLVPRLGQPALFFLDGHYSGPGTSKGSLDTPIFNELTHIFRSPDARHVIVIDDARLFGTDPAYPSIPELTRFVQSLSKAARVSVEDDCIRVTPY